MSDETTWMVQTLTVVPFATDDGPTTPAELHYETSDPYAVRLRLHHSPSLSESWTFGRDLLIEGICTPTGDGDVHVWPSEDGGSMVIIECCAPGFETLVAAPGEGVCAFLEQSLRMVPRGDEGNHLDVDRAIAAILASSRR